MEKVVKGVTYITVDSDYGCNGCAASRRQEDICNDLVEKGCSEQFIWCRDSGQLTATRLTEGVKYDSDKTQYSLVPPYALEAVAKNLTAGLKKYPHRNNWMQVDKAEERYLDALMRHLEAHRKGEIYDKDNIDPTTTHMSAVAVNAMFLLELMLNPQLNKEIK